MQETENFLQTSARMSDKTFKVFSEYIQNTVGIKMPHSKKIMLQSRLQKRLRQLRLSSYEEYKEYVFQNSDSDEIVHMIDAVTTNKTEFFREANHFICLLDSILPQWMENKEPGSRRRFEVWSAGCSTGEEPYTLSITLKEFQKNNPRFDFQIYATDISTRVLEYAHQAIYPEQRIDAVPLELRKKYFLRSKDPAKSLVRLRPEVRQKVTFERLNFMEEAFNIPDLLDVIFCRNVIIYFERQTQYELLLKFMGHLKVGGFLFLGHSETLNGLDIPFEMIAPTVYQKIG